MRLVDVQRLNGFSNADRIVSVPTFCNSVRKGQEDLLGLRDAASIRMKQRKPKP